MRARALTGLALLAALASTAARSDGRIPVFQQATLTQSGHYVVTRDILAQGGPAIVIEATDVRLDLNGHTVRSQDASGITIEPPLFEAKGRVEVRNGRVRGGTHGVFHQGRVEIRLERLDVANDSTLHPPVVFDGALVVEMVGCTVSSLPGSGSAVEAPFFDDGEWSGTFTGNRLHVQGHTGFLLQRINAGLIADNIVHHSGDGYGYGMLIGLSIPGVGGVRVERNLVHSEWEGATGLQWGIFMSGQNLPAAMVGNVLTGRMGTGIALALDGGLVTDNVLGAGTFWGITVSGNHNTIRANTISAAGGDGIEVFGSNNLIDANVIEGNQSYGIDFEFAPTSTNVYRRNMLRHNGLGAVNGNALDAGGNIP